MEKKQRQILVFWTLFTMFTLTGKSGEIQTANTGDITKWVGTLRYYTDNGGVPPASAPEQVISTNNSIVSNTLEGTITAKGVAYHWKFDNDASDSGPNGKDGVISGTASFEEGKHGNCLVLDGTQHVKVSNFSGQLDAISISTWVYGSTELGSTSQTSFFAGYSDTIRNLNCHLPWSGKVYWDAPNSNRIDKSVSPAAYKGQWHHWVFTKDPVSGIMKIFLDGVQWMSGTGKHAEISTIDTFYIGNNSAETLPYKGKIDDFRIYNYALDGTEVASLYNSYSDILTTDFTPANGATAANPTADLVAEFNANIALTSTGTIAIKKSEDHTVVTSYNLATTTGNLSVTVSGSTLTLNPDVDLDSETSYYVEITAGAIDEATDGTFLSAYSGLGASDWSFTTAPSSFYTTNYSFEPNEFLQFSPAQTNAPLNNNTVVTHNDGSIWTMENGSYVINHWNLGSGDLGLQRSGDYAWGTQGKPADLIIELPQSANQGVKSVSAWFKHFNDNNDSMQTVLESSDGTTWNELGRFNATVGSWGEQTFAVNSIETRYIKFERVYTSLDKAVIAVDDISIDYFGSKGQTVNSDMLVEQITDRAFQGEARDVQVLKLSITAIGSEEDPYKLTDLNLVNSGTAVDGVDFDGVEIYYTGAENDYLKAVSEGKTRLLYLGPTGNITLTTQPDLNVGENNFFVIYKLNATARAAVTLDAQVDGYTLDGGNNIAGDITKDSLAGGAPDGDNIVIRTHGGNDTVKVVLLSGQSNAQGKAKKQDFDIENRESVAGVEFWLGGANPALGIAKIGSYEHNAYNDFAPSVPHGTGLIAGTHSGVEIVLAKTLKAAYSEESLAIIKYSHGSSGLGKEINNNNASNFYPGADGDPDTYDPELGWRYRVMRDSAILPALRKITERGDSFELLSMYWIQGEADSARSEADYRTDLVNLYDRVSREFFSAGMSFYQLRLNNTKTNYANSGVYKVFTKLGRDLISSNSGVDKTDVAAYTLADITAPLTRSGSINFDLNNVFTIDSNPYGVDTGTADSNPNPGMVDNDVHYNAQALEELGYLMASDMIARGAVTPVLGLSVTQMENRLSWRVEQEIGIQEYRVVDVETGELIMTVSATNQGLYVVTLPSDSVVKLVVVDDSAFQQTYYPENGDLSTLDYELVEGWNLISITVTNADLSELNKATTGEFWRWNGDAYEQTSTPEPTQGVWVYAPSPTTVSVTGKLSELEIVLETGWNLVGATKNVTIPMDATNIYCWNDMYQTIAIENGILLQGVGYWIFSF